MIDTPAQSPAPEPAKADPETLVLRAPPGRITRFRRGAIIAIAAAGSAAIAGVAWLALRPAALGLVASDDERNLVATGAAGEVLAGAPASYGDVPQLGRPLPGDLGKPILEHQRKMSMADPADPSENAAARAAQAAEAERQRVAAEQRAARASGVMLQFAGVARQAAPAAIVEPATPLPAGAEGDGAPGYGPSGPRRESALVGRAGRDDAISPHALAEPVSPWTLLAGTVIAASLITGVNSDLPGLVTAQVTENVYDSATGRSLLIPQGSRLIGSYDSIVAFGQSRVLVVWQRILLPGGSSIRIDNVPATDTQGYAGLSDRIDRHTWQLLKGVALSTLLGVGTEFRFADESDLVEAIRESAQQGGARAGDQLVRRNLDVEPTLAVRPGWPLRIVLHKDLVLPGPWDERHG